MVLQKHNKFQVVNGLFQQFIETYSVNLMEIFVQLVQEIWAPLDRQDPQEILEHLDLRVLLARWVSRVHPVSRATSGHLGQAAPVELQDRLETKDPPDLLDQRETLVPKDRLDHGALPVPRELPVRFVEYKSSLFV